MPVQRACDEIALDLSTACREERRRETVVGDETTALPGTPELRDFRRQVLHGDGAACRAERHGALDLTAQLTHVAGPPVLREQVEDARAQLDVSPAQAFARFTEEVACEVRHLFASFAEGGTRMRMTLSR